MSFLLEIIYPILMPLTFMGLSILSILLLNAILYLTEQQMLPQFVLLLSGTNAMVITMIIFGLIPLK
ncbi:MULTISPECIES: hypothetical protein [Bacillus cereus group]|uniref:hypothetical protein n=1 Tax=Bacillus cereus group TaxID=86661 RepID=UPI0021581B75|nr:MULTISPECIES: hypothetical protein [Bacillus cereus group]MCR6795760.1 hypothetical protein [Bacillus paranthracis]MDA2202907.1 hypothetical protein [Bacillus cereus group sp. Bc237]MDA2760860.1 hypothetical protein [Bacillus cereus group sp. Bc007]MDA2766525.1 hypothetical protein [Bacillus cereus group sp. Bc008]MDA2777668.1 hypothetical protein [Bacillus cereus group sp. Bc005]